MVERFGRRAICFGTGEMSCANHPWGWKVIKLVMELPGLCPETGWRLGRAQVCTKYEVNTRTGRCSTLMPLVGCTPYFNGHAGGELGSSIHITEYGGLP